jgi:hypothetical protein
MKDIDDLLAAAAHAPLTASDAAVDALGQRLALQPNPSALDSARDLRRLTACLVVAGVFGALTTSGLGMLERKPAVSAWPAEALAVQPSSLLTAGGRG